MYIPLVKRLLLDVKSIILTSVNSEGVFHSGVGVGVGAPERPKVSESSKMIRPASDSVVRERVDRFSLISSSRNYIIHKVITSSKPRLCFETPACYTFVSLVYQND